MRFTLFSVGRVPSLSDVSELASRLGFHGDKDEFRKASWEYCEETLIGRGSAFKQSPSIFLVICDGTLIMIHTHHINCCNGQLHQHCTADQVPHCAGLKERERESENKYSRCEHLGSHHFPQLHPPYVLLSDQFEARKSL